MSPTPHSDETSAVDSKKVLAPLRLVLVHGTWSDGSRWTGEKTLFFKRITKMLRERGYDPSDPHRVKWHSWNRAKARETAKQDLLSTFRRETRANAKTPILIVAHSHGGNFSTGAFREAERTEETFPVRGIVCLNTPFLTQELRASNSFLKLWLLLAILLFLLPVLVNLGSVDKIQSLSDIPRILLHYPETSLPELFWPLNNISPGLMLAAYAAICVVLILMIMLARKYRVAKPAQYQRKPRVLCLSCCDDEAISFLGFGEGLANLSHFAFHPIALLICLIIGSVITYFRFDTLTTENWFSVMRHFFIVWTLIALAFSTVASVWVSLLFGHGPSDAVKSLVSRTLVSYVPLRPAKADFRAVSDLVGPWWKPRLFHSSIYDSEQTIQEIDAWLDNVLPRLN